MPKSLLHCGAGGGIDVLTLRKSEDRGQGEHGWLSERHSFSFGGYHDPRFQGFGHLRVINEDRIAPGGGFPTHGHADMEIVTYIIEGTLAHKDSTGTGAIIYPGDAQRMSAGTGIRHSEYNASQTAPVHLLQIWIEPGRQGLAPAYQQAALPPLSGGPQLDLIGGPDGGAVAIHQDVRLWRAIVPAGDSLSVPLARNRKAWVQLIKGSGTLNGIAISAGDGIAALEETGLVIAASSPIEALVFDLQ